MPPRAKKPPQPVTFDIDARDLLRGLHNARVFTGSDRSLPVLTSVLIESDKDGLSFVATDRYTIGVTTIPCKARSFGFVLRRADLDLLLKLFNPKSGDLTLTIDGDRMTVEPAKALFNQPNVIVTCTALDVVFPKYRQILDGTYSTKKHEPYEVGSAIGLNPAYIARFARVKPNGGNGGLSTALRLSVRSASSPLFVEIGEQFKGCIMPVRLADESATVTPKASAA